MLIYSIDQMAFILFILKIIIVALQQTIFVENTGGNNGERLLYHKNIVWSTVNNKNIFYFVSYNVLLSIMEHWTVPWEL